MSVNNTSISWNGTPNPAWGLVAKIGPYKMTSKDEKNLNSRSGGPNAGHANSFYSIKPRPFIQTAYLRPKYVNDSIITDEDFAPPKGIKVPGINRAGSNSTRNITGKRIEEIKKNNMQVLQNKEQGGLDYSDDSIIARNLTRPTIIDDDLFRPNSTPGSPVSRSSIGSRRESGAIVASPLQNMYNLGLGDLDDGINFLPHRNPRGRNTFRNPSTDTTSSSMSE